jgi:hypothetical protein
MIDNKLVKFPPHIQRFLDYLKTDEFDAKLERHCKMLKHKEDRIERLSVIINDMDDVRFDEFINKIINKFNIGRNGWLEIIFETSELYGQSHESELDWNKFESYWYSYRGYDFRRYDGQGSVYTISNKRGEIYSSSRY